MTTLTEFTPEQRELAEKLAEGGTLRFTGFPAEILAPKREEESDETLD